MLLTDCCLMRRKHYCTLNCIEIYCSGGVSIIVNQLTHALDTLDPTVGGPSARPSTSNLTLIQILRKVVAVNLALHRGNVLRVGLIRVRFFLE